MKNNNFLIMMIVIVGIVIGAMAIVFYFFFAEDVTKFNRAEEMKKCIERAQVMNQQALWTVTDEGKACLNKYKDVWQGE